MTLIATKPETEEMLEKRIAGELMSMQCSQALGNRERAMLHWLEMCRLIKRRSAHKVAQMEREQGLR